MPEKSGPLTIKPIFVPFAALAAQTTLTKDALLANPFVPGVSMMTIGQAKGHSVWHEATEAYLPEWVDARTLQTIAEAAFAAGGKVRSKDGHYGGLGDSLGIIANIRVDGDKARGDLTLLNTYEEFEHLCNLIATAAETFGMSLDCCRDHEIVDGKAYIRVTEIFTCDLVDAPAANKALFDSQPKTKSMAEPTTPAPAAPAASTPAPAAPAAAPDTAAITAAVEAGIAPLKADVAALTTKVNDLAAKVEAAPGTPPAAPAEPPVPPAMAALTQRLAALEAKQGIAAAAFSGAAPAATPAGEAPKKLTAFERNLEAAKKLIPTA